MKILIIDDNPSHLQAFQATNAHHEVVTATSGIDGIRPLQVTSFDLLMLGDGSEAAAEWLTSNPQCRPLQVISYANGAEEQRIQFYLSRYASPVPYAWQMVVPEDPATHSPDLNDDPLYYP